MANRCLICGGFAVFPGPALPLRPMLCHLCKTTIFGRRVAVTSDYERVRAVARLVRAAVRRRARNTSQ